MKQLLLFLRVSVYLPISRCCCCLCYREEEEGFLFHFAATTKCFFRSENLLRAIQARDSRLRHAWKRKKKLFSFFVHFNQEGTFSCIHNQLRVSLGLNQSGNNQSYLRKEAKKSWVTFCPRTDGQTDWLNAKYNFQCPDLYLAGEVRCSFFIIM